MKRAYLNLRHNVPERIEAVTQGLQRLGYYVTLGWPHGEPRDCDVLVTWNRIHDAHTKAKQFANVLVMENASWGNGFHARRWYTLCRDYHNRADCIIDRGPERWAALDMQLPPLRTLPSGETVILPQRGIGPPGVAMPLDWPRQALVKHKGRIRRHPGREPGTDLKVDLWNARRVITWGSGAAIKALMWGIPVVSEMPLWIGEQDNTERGRWEMLCRLAWAQWELKEFADGSAFAHYLRA